MDRQQVLRLKETARVHLASCMVRPIISARALTAAANLAYAIGCSCCAAVVKVLMELVLAAAEAESALRLLWGKGPEAVKAAECTVQCCVRSCCLQRSKARAEAGWRADFDPAHTAEGWSRGGGGGGGREE